MLTYSPDPDLADQQVRAILFYLTVFGYIDGEFSGTEKAFIREYISRLVPGRVQSTGVSPGDADFERVCEQYERRFLRHFDRIDQLVQEVLDEAVATGDDRHQYAYGKLKVRCFEIFQSFDEENQRQLLETVDELIRADGVIHPAEVQFREELTRLLRAEAPEAEEEPEEPAPVAPKPEVFEPGLHLEAAQTVRPQGVHLPLLDALEVHFAADPHRLMAQISDDHRLVSKAMELLERQRQQGAATLEHTRSTAELLSEEATFLDGHLYGVPPQSGRRYELTVVGDLHGCYSCLKAALAQSDFLSKVEAFRADPDQHPDPKLIFLGNYVDRGRYGFEGVLRAVLTLFTTYPEHVFPLRGNHEHYRQEDEETGSVTPGVEPAESFEAMAPHWPPQHLDLYRRLFESLPVALLFDDTIFVHGGIPRDQTWKPSWQGLATLNDPDVRFEMLWSDPSEADYIPDDVQQSSTRFDFGTKQFADFMRRVDANTMIRGHQRVGDGFAEKLEVDGVRLFTLFSAGGAENADLPPDSPYRQVSPAAASIVWADGVTTMAPWAIDWAAFNRPEANGFVRTEPELPAWWEVEEAEPAEPEGEAAEPSEGEEGEPSEAEEGAEEAGVAAAPEEAAEPSEAEKGEAPELAEGTDEAGEAAAATPGEGDEAEPAAEEAVTPSAESEPALTSEPQAAVATLVEPPPDAQGGAPRVEDKPAAEAQPETPAADQPTLGEAPAAPPATEGGERTLLDRPAEEPPYSPWSEADATAQTLWDEELETPAEAPADKPAGGGGDRD